MTVLDPSWRLITLSSTASPIWLPAVFRSARVPASLHRRRPHGVPRGAVVPPNRAGRVLPALRRRRWRPDAVRTPAWVAGDRQVALSGHSTIWPSLGGGISSTGRHHACAHVSAV